MKPSWVRRLFAVTAPRPVRKNPPRARLVLDPLEDRAVPATFTVLNTLDDGSAGSLRWAIDQANGNVGGDTVDFAVSGTITLQGAQLELTDTTGATTIAGPAAGVTVDGGGLSRVFQIAEGAAASFSRLTITGGALSDGESDGGGLLNLGTATLTNCTVSGNVLTGFAPYYYTGGSGAGVANRGTLSMTGCTVSGNSTAYGTGGGLYNSGTATLTNCTVSGNSASFAGGIYNGYDGGTAALTNTIVAGNANADVNFTGFSGTNNLIGDDALLAPLGNYGGPTPTMPLLPGSPAIDAGTAGADVPNTDQRGAARVGAVDIGAFESQGFRVTLSSGTPAQQTAKIGTSFKPLSVTVTANDPSEPVDGGVVSFVAGRVNGATAMLSAASAVIAGGRATAAAAPNNATGSYTVVASVPGLAPVSFALTNAGPVYTSLVVNTTSDALIPGAGLLSLREAVAFFNFDTLKNSSAITFDKKVFGTAQTITLTGGQLELSNTAEAVTITGPKAGVTVSGGGLSRVFQIDSLVTASLSGVTITGGNAGYYFNGGGLLNFGTVALSNCTVSGNTAGPAGFSYNGGGNGGGIANFGTLELTKCSILGNTSNGGYFSTRGGSGGGVYNAGTATLTNCTVSGNSTSGGFGIGGAVNSGAAFGDGTARTTLTNCTVSGNSGFGVSNYDTTTLTNCTVSGNSAGGVSSSAALRSPLGFTSTVTLRNCIVSGNSGVGVITASSVFGSGTSARILSAATNLINCTVSGNADTGLYTVGGATTATNTTIRDNHAGLDGGGVFTAGLSFSVQVNGTTDLTNCVIGGNSADRNGGGVFVGGLGTVTLTDCIVAANSAVNGGGVFTQGLAVPQVSRGQPPSALVTRATIDLNNSTVSSNTASGNGGGVFVGGFSTATLTDSTVRDNHAGLDGGGVFSQGLIQSVRLSSTVTVQVTGSAASDLANSTVSGNTAKGAGGGLMNSTLSTTTVTGSTIKDNSAVSGGGIANRATLTIDDSTIKQNHATSKGGGISTTGGSVTITDSTIKDNEVFSSGIAVGGGIASENTVLSLINSTVRGNTAHGTTAQGGGISLLGGSLTVEGSSVNNNEVNGQTAQGGGIYALDAAVSLLRSQVKGNEANGYQLGQGGGIYSRGGTLSLSATVVKNNDASTGGDDQFFLP